MTNNSNKQEDVNRNKHINYILKANHNPKSKIELRLHNLRLKHAATNYLSPLYDTKVIYCLYDIFGHKNSPLYIGQTSRTAYARAQQEISDALAGRDRAPLSKYICRLGRFNVGVFVLQQVENVEELHHYERLWIHRLETHTNRPNRQALNINPEHRPIHIKHRSKIKNKNNNNIIKNKPDTQIHIPKIISTILCLAIRDNRAEIIAKLTLTKLFKILSACTGKKVHYRAKPTSKEQEETAAASLVYLKSKMSPNRIADIIELTSEQTLKLLDGLKSDKRIKKRNFPSFQICTIQNIGEYTKFIPITKIMNKYVHMLPKPINSIAQPIIIYKNRPPTSKKLYNFVEASKLITEKAKDIIAPCECNNIPDIYKRNNHVNTGNLNVLYHIINATQSTKKELIELMNLGTKYIETPKIDHHLIYITYTQAIDKYVEKLMKFTKQDIESFTLWSNKVKKKIYNAINKHIPYQAHTEKLKNANINHAIDELKNKCVITCIDKMPNNYSVTCKKYWIIALHNNTLDYKQTSHKIAHTSEEKIIARHKKYLNKNKFKVTPKLPIKYITTKQHKEGWRPISAAAATTTTHLSKTLVVAINAIINALKIEAHTFYMLTGVRTFYDIENAADLRLRINEMNNDKNHQPQIIETADITGWYDNVDHYDAIRILKNIIYETFKDIKRRLYLKIQGKTATWSNTYAESNYYTHNFTAASLLRLIVWRLRNQYAKVGNIVVKQIIGTGQGDNHSGHLCRLISIYYERKFAKYWTKTDIERAKQFNNVTRKHDDYAFFNNLNISDYLYKNKKQPGLIPKYFTLKWTTDQPDSSNYLDTTIHIIPNPHINRFNYESHLNNKSHDDLRKLARKLQIKQKGNKQDLTRRILQFKNPVNNFHNKQRVWNIKTYNKKDAFNINFKINSFPHYSTNIPNHCKFGAVTGQLHSYVITNYLNLTNFIINTKNLLSQLHNQNKYPKYKLLRIFNKFIHDKQYIFHTPAAKVLKILTEYMPP